MRVIKKYSNRRLYDTSSSTYVNLDNLADIIREGELVQIVDARTGADLTRTVLMQVILEAQGAIDLMPVGLLHRMIRLSSSNPMHTVFRKQLSAGLELLDAQVTRMEQQLQIFRPSQTKAPQNPPPEEPPPDEPPPEEPAEAAEPEQGMDDLRARLAALEARLGSSAE